MHLTSRGKSIAAWLIIFFLFVFLVVGVSKLLSRKAVVKPPAQPSSNGSVVQKVSSSSSVSGSGTLRLVMADKADVVSTEKQAVVRVVAASGNTAVVGYDVVISYDPSLLSYVATDHLLSDYSSTVRIDGGKLTISGVTKKDGTPRVMDETVLEALRFQPLKTGKTVITIAFAPGALNESNLMSGQTRDILGKVSPLSFIIGTPLTIGLGETKAIDNSTLALRLDRISVPSSTCRDCITSQDLTVIDSAKRTQTSFGFRAGGFAGAIHDEARSGGYIFKLSESTDKSITVLVAAE